MNAGINLQNLLSYSLARRCTWGALWLLLVSNLPIFVCTRLSGDATYYDLQVQCLNAGGVLYRDLLEPNLPGVVWIHILVRAIGGPSTVALRVFDLLVLGGIVAILVHWNRRQRTAASHLSGPCLALSVCWCYLSLSSSSQCQRDMWMLLPSLGALLLRDRSLELMTRRSVSRLSFTSSLLEGVLWGCAFWIKPHVAVPALLVMLVSMLWSKTSRLNLVSFCGVLGGGLLAGAVGSSWLIASGAWTHFWDIQLHWNPEYLASRANWPWIERCVSLFHVLSPWSWAHLVALPFAVLMLVDAVRRTTRFRSAESSANRHPLLLCALYLGWCTQSIALQHPFAYTHVPGVILAMGIIAGIRWRPDWHLVPRAVTAMVFLFAIVVSPCTKPSRLACWRDCITQGPSVAVQARIEAQPGPYWVYYPEVVRFLQSRNVRGKDVLVYSAVLVGLYTDLDLRPPIRYALPDVHGVFFGSRVPEIRQAIEQSPHRYVVSDISGFGMNAKSLEEINPETGLPMTYPQAELRRFPATQPVVFRSGWFVVHEARNPIGPLANEAQ